MQLIGFSPIAPDVISAIVSAAYSFGSAGNVTVSTGRLTAIKGGYVLSTTSGKTSTSGNGGDVVVNGTDFVKLIGVSPTFAPSLLGTTTFGAGKAGNLAVNTQNLVIQNGGRIDSATVATGDAGNVTVNASNSIEVSQGKRILIIY